MKVVSINSNSFKSKVVYEKSAPQRPLTYSEKNFLDRFDDGDRSGAKLLGEGVTAKAYYVPEHNFVIKQNHDNPYVPKKHRGELGSLAHENDILLSIDPHVEHAQKGIAYAETAKGGKYLISGFVHGKAANVNSNPLTSKRIDRLLRTLYRLDKSEILQPDLSRPNILFDEYGYANLIDFQYGEKFNTNGNYSGYNLTTAEFPPYEAPNNATMFEGAALSGYLRELNESDARSVLTGYTMNKAVYNAKKAKRLTGSTADVEIYKKDAFESLSDGVLEAEVLKMNILNCQRRQYSCHDPNVISERNVLRAIPLMIRAINSAQELANFPKYSENKKYFEYMRNLGNFWLKKFSNWYPATVECLYKLVSGYKTTTSRVLFPNKYDDFSNIDLVKIYNSDTAIIEKKHLSEDLKIRDLFKKAAKYGYSYDGKTEVVNTMQKLFR